MADENPLDAALAKAMERYQAAQQRQPVAGSRNDRAPTFRDPIDLDTRSGAPAGVRAAVGAAQTPQDRLSTLRQSYPDATPYDGDNFTFVDPKTGRRVLYNPRGFDLGDVVSVSPEIGEGLGGIAGGALSIGGAPATGGASLLAAPVGIGLGAAAGRETAVALGRMFNGTQDTRTLPQRLTDTATTAAINGVAAPVGEAIGAGVRALSGPVSRAFGARTGAEAVRDFDALGVPLTAGAVTGNPTMQVLERGIGATPGGAMPIAGAVERQGEALGGAVARQAETLAGGRTPLLPGEAGASLKAGANAAVDRFQARQTELYDNAFNLIGADTPAALPSVQRLGAELQADLARAPESRGRVLAPVMRRLADLAADAGDSGAVRFDVLRNIRTDLRRELSGSPNAASAPTSDARVYLERLYGALTDDIGATARAAGPEAAQALSTADRYTRFNRQLNLPALERVLAANTDEAAYRLAFPQNGKPDAQSLARITRNLQPEERKALAATVLDRMGNPTPGAAAGETFSPATFLTNWNKLTASGPAARRVLFGAEPQLAAQLDRFTRVASRLRDVQRGANFSNTAPVALAGAAAITAGNDIANGDPAGLLKTLFVSALAPHVAARLMTSSNFVRWMADVAPAAARGSVPEGSIRALTRVGAVNPEIREDVEALRSLLRPAPGPSTRR